MDASVVASVASFFVSERVLKPKASLLVILGCVLAYDLTTKTQDVSSLRVYRGPGLLAFSLMMVALSLRMWRRNGIACDELLFLPGTPHGESTTQYNGGSSETLAGGSVHTTTRETTTSNDTVLYRTPPSNKNALREGDVAAGGVMMMALPASPSLEQQQPVLTSTTVSSPNRPRILSRDSSSQSSIHEFLNAWDDDDDDLDNVDLEGRQLVPSSSSQSNSNNNRDATSLHQHNVIASSQLPESSERSSSRLVQGFREQHPRITRMGTFFFFRSSTSSTQSAAYAPSGPSVMGAALDLCMPVLFNFHLFIEAWNHLDNNNNSSNHQVDGSAAASSSSSETPAKILPMIFLTVLIVRSVVPPGRRGRFWSTMRFTALAPLHSVPFRDAYIGDILTSLVRPFQDILFALAYYVTVLCGTITSNYSLSESSVMLQHSWLLHNVVLPSCAILPLWWKFLQTLRQAYDTKQRWPYLGNAAKYLSAGIVILYGMTHREDRRSPWWIPAFAITLLYQIFWDTIMDWELFEIAPRETDAMDVSEPSWLNRFSSGPPNCAWMLTVKRVVVPIIDTLRLKLGRIPSVSQLRMRQTRLYKTEKFYWRIFVYNTAFRFCWMLCFIPAYHFSSSEKVTTFSSDTKSYVGVLLPIAEIVRRTLWGFLHLEKETIRMHESGRMQAYNAVDNGDTNDDEEYELASISIHSTSKGRLYLPPWLNSQQQMHQDAAMALSSSSSSNVWGNMSKWFQYTEETRDTLFKAELSAWAIAFILLGGLATT